MSAQVESCPLCGGASVYALTARDRNRETTDERFAYNRCATCQTIFLVDVPDDLARFYGGDYHGFDADGQPEWTHNPTLQEVDAFRMKMLRRHVQPGALIDIGAGAGAFAAAAQREGFEVTAIEMDPRCCEYLADEIGVQAICSDQPTEELSALPPAEVISLWHSLEHVRDPAAMLAAAADRLVPGGVLAVGVPNTRALQFRLLGSRWAHLDAPRHLSLIPEAALASSLAPLGLRRLEATTADPFGAVCNLFGWTCALRSRPALGDPPANTIRAARVITALLRPIEDRRRRGSALTVLFGKARFDKSRS